MKRLLQFVVVDIVLNPYNLNRRDGTMETYTNQDVQELAHQFELVYPSLDFINFNQDSLDLCLKDYPNDPVRAILEFLIGYYMLGTTQELAQATYDFTFEVPLRDMPKYTHDDNNWKKAVSSWRMKIGK